MDLDQLIRDADPAHGLDIEVPDPSAITRQDHGLDRGAADGSGHQPVRRRIRSIGSRVALGGSVLVAVAVAVIVLAVGRHPHSPAGLTGAGSRGASGSGLAVFRRPQTAGDRTMTAVVYRAARLGGLPQSFASQALAGAISGTTRYLQTLPDGREAFLFQARASGVRAANVPVAEGRRMLRLIIVQPEGKWTDGQPIMGFGGSLPTNRIALIEALSGGGCALNTVFSVIPNNVTWVRWQFPRQDRYGYLYKAPLTLNVPVRGNYAIATIPGRASCDKPSVITLYGRDGNVIATKGNPAKLDLITRPIRHGDPTAGLKQSEHRP